MLFNEFLQLNETEQIELLWYNGEQIGRRKEKDYIILLYQVEGFYVEVFYHRKARVIKRYLSFDCSDRRLQPYLNKIDLTPVYRQIRKSPRSNEPFALTKENKQGFWNTLLSVFQINR